MFTVQELSLDNFMSIESLTLRFDSPSTIAITGANGAGKSTIFMAIALCLTGYKRGDTYKECIRSGEKEAHVQMVATLAGKHISYDIKIQQNGLTRTVRFDGQEYINSAYKQVMEEYKLDVLQNIMFMFQGSSSLIDATPAERSTLLRELFQFDFSDLVASFTESQLNETSVRNTLEGSLSELENRTFIRKPLKRCISQEAIESLKREEELLNDKYKELNNLDTSKFATISREITGLNAKILRLDQNIRDVNSCIEDFESRYETVPDFDSEIAQKEVEQRAAQKVLMQAQTDLENIRRSESTVNADLKIAEHERDQAKKYLEVGKSGVCLSCGNVIDAEHLARMQEAFDKADTVVRMLKEDLAKLDVPYFSKAYLDAEKAVRTVTAELQNLDTQKDKYKYAYESYRQNISNLDQLYVSLSAIRVAREEKQAQLNSYADLSHRQTTELPTIKQELEDIRQRIATAQEARIYNEHATEENRLIEAEELSCKDRKHELSSRINESRQKATVYADCIKIFRQAFPAYVVLQACQNLEAYINYVVQKAFPSLTVRLQQTRTGVCFSYSKDGGVNWLNISMASGAERQVIQIANQLALARMYNLQCVFLDEVDASCSDTNASIIFEFIATLDEFEQIFFITHRSASLQAMKDVKDNMVCFDVQDGTYVQVW